MEQIIIVFIFIVLWNVFNNNTVLSYAEQKTASLLEKWHIYDAFFRTLIIAYVIYAHFGLTIHSLKVLVAATLAYGVIFDILFNISRLKQLKLNLRFIYVFYTGTTATTDKLIRKVGILLQKVLGNQENTYAGINAIIKGLEIVAIVCLLL